MHGLYFPVAAIGFQVLNAIFVIGVLWFLFQISQTLRRIADQREKNKN
ncbi:MAG: hypothetical protein H6Q73_469 [Firmicutes bacterium]|nr:hypothetical protein [Bacillota bacterium]